MQTRNGGFFSALGARVAQARKERGLTQQQVTDHLGVGRQTLTHFEAGRARIAASLLPPLAEILDMSIEEILTGQPLSRVAGKRGPAARVQQQVEEVGQLPKAKQRSVVEKLDP